MPVLSVPEAIPEAVPEVLLKQVADAADLIESGGRLPDDLAADLREFNAFSLLLPEELGGKQTPYPDFLRIVQAFAQQDGSVGWCVGQGSVLSTLARQLPSESARKIWDHPGNAVANGPPGDCSATLDGDDYLVSGTWSFSSGIAHASWLIGMAPVKDKDGKNVDFRWCFFPKEAAEISDRWPVNGLKGTASYGFSVQELRVATDMAIRQARAKEGPALYRIPMNLLFACGFGAVALGVSRAALDCAIDRCKSRIRRFDKEALALSQSIQEQLGRAEAGWHASHAYLHATAENVWKELDSGMSLTDEHRLALRTAGTHVIHQCRDITDSAYQLCSTEGIFTDNQIQRRFQDMHVITQHLQARSDIYGLVGRYHLGLPYESFLIE